MKSVYLVLDMENDLVGEDGPNGKSPLGAQVRERGILDKTAKAIERARAFRLGTPGTEIHAKLGRKEGDWLITKHRVSPFYSTDLDTYLRANGSRIAARRIRPRSTGTRSARSGGSAPSRRSPWHHGFLGRRPM